MSRPYETMGSGFESYAASGRGSAGKWMRRLLIWGAVIVLLAGWWVTRDTFPRWRAVHASPGFIAVIDQPVDNYVRIADSGFWNAVPPGWDPAPIREVLRRDYGVPTWVQRNVIGAQCFVSAESTSRLEEVVAVTRMSRIGCLVERAASHLSPRIDRDWAGGLELRQVPDAGVFYAVRGRTFIVSASRDALIRTLTLPPDAAMTETAFSAELAEGGLEDIRGKAVFEEAHPWGGVVQAVGFAVRLDTTVLTTHANVAFHPEWQWRLQPLLARARQTELPAPAGTMLDVQMDLGLSPRAFVDALQHAVDPEGQGVSWWESWATIPASEEGSYVPFAFTTLLEDAGAALSLGVHGVDLNELIPMPEIVAVLPSGGEWNERVAALRAAPWPGAPPVPPIQVEEDSDVVSVAMVGGASLKPSFAVRRGELIVSNSRALVDHQAGRGPAPATEQPKSGNLAITAAPLDCANAVIDYGRLLAGVGALKGFTPDSFDIAAAGWQEWAARLKQIAAVAARNDGGVSIEGRVELNQ